LLAEAEAALTAKALVEQAVVEFVHLQLAHFLDKILLLCQHRH
jgi:hypothetical protein